MYKKEIEKIEIEAKIKRSYDKEIKKKIKKYNNSFNSEITSLQARKRDGLRVALKGLSGICG